MISLPAGVRVLLATRPVDFRRGAHALAALAAEELGENPFSGVVLVFRSKRCDKVKIVHWDATGLVLVWKQNHNHVCFFGSFCCRKRLKAMFFCKFIVCATRTLTNNDI